ncbi:MAG TPA: hypothetical protein VF937_15230 [Chloroflexota bacterium]
MWRCLLALAAILASVLWGRVGLAAELSPRPIQLSVSPVSGTAMPEVSGRSGAAAPVVDAATTPARVA